MPLTRLRARRHARPRQHGAASLVVVAVLFFVLAIVAAYTNRSMLFEQRTSANQYRATQAFEAAEAGVEWALSMLNSGRIDDACTPTADAGLASFRDRYLAIDPATGAVTPGGVLSADGGGTRWPGCVFDGTDWDCGCPEEGKATPTAPEGTGVFPAFRVRFKNAGGAGPGLVQLEVNACTRLNDDCLDFPAAGLGGEGRATLRLLVALRSGLPSIPLAAVTVQDNLVVGAPPNLGAFNADAASGGTSILAGGSTVLADGTPVDAETYLRLGTTPGTPAGGSVALNDVGLAALPNAERLFTNTFAIGHDDYRNQPGAVVLDCDGGCDAADVRTAAARHPGHVVWAEGDLNLDTGGDVGSPDQPVLIVVTGDITVDVTLYGLIYRGRDAGTWAGSGQVRGAAMAEGDLAGDATFDVVYDADVLQRLHRRTGSFLVVPGSWRDY